MQLAWPCLPQIRDARLEAASSRPASSRRGPPTAAAKRRGGVQRRLRLARAVRLAVSELSAVFFHCNRAYEIPNCCRRALCSIKTPPPPGPPLTVGGCTADARAPSAGYPARVADGNARKCACHGRACAKSAIPRNRAIWYRAGPHAGSDTAAGIGCRIAGGPHPPLTQQREEIRRWRAGSAASESSLIGFLRFDLPPALTLTAGTATICENRPICHGRRSGWPPGPGVAAFFFWCVTNNAK